MAKTRKITLRSKYNGAMVTVEKIDKKTKVVPNESMTVREMLMKHANGTLFDNFKTPFYEEQATFSTTKLNQIQNMDLTDKLIFLQEIEQKAKALKDKVDSHYQEQLNIAKSKEVTQAQQSEAPNTN